MCIVMNIAQNVCFFVNFFIQLPQEPSEEKKKIMKKPGLCLCEQQKRRYTCASTQSDRCLSCSLFCLDSVKFHEIVLED